MACGNTRCNDNSIQQAQESNFPGFDKSATPIATDDERAAWRALCTIDVLHQVEIATSIDTNPIETTTRPAMKAAVHSAKTAPKKLEVQRKPTDTGVLVNCSIACVTQSSPSISSYAYAIHGDKKKIPRRKFNESFENKGGGVP